MKTESKKIAAAMVGILRYLEEEKGLAPEAESDTTSGVLPGAGPERRVPEGSAWGLSGRAEIMQLRHLMQLRTFRH